MIENREKITAESVQDDLNIILEELIKNPNKIPNSQSLDQLEYDLDCLKDLLNNVEDPNDSQIPNLINLINRILKTYRVDLSPIKVSRFNKNRLRSIKVGYNDALGTVLDFYEKNHDKK